MSQQNNDIKSSNEMSLKQLIIKENAELKQIRNPKNGKCFFTCGNKRGYISPNAAQKLADPAATLDDFKYAEISINGNEAVPCLMIVGNGNANVMRTLGAELLR